jgi:hypothetical protein
MARRALALSSGCFARPRDDDTRPFRAADLSCLPVSWSVATPLSPTVNRALGRAASARPLSSVFVVALTHASCLSRDARATRALRSRDAHVTLTRR